MAKSREDENISSLEYSGDNTVRLDKFLLSQVESFSPGTTRSQLKQWIASGQVSVNHEVQTKAGFVLKPGARVKVSVESSAGKHELECYDFPIAILYEDEYIIVIDKPVGISMHPGAGNRSKTVVNALAGRLKKIANSKATGPLRPGVVHRLDKDTSGVVVLAKTVRSHSHLAKQFAARTVSRAYLALVVSTPRRLRPTDQADRGVIETLIGRDLRDRRRMAVVEEGGKNAITRWQVKERFRHASLLEVVLGTGRTHQIRVHMQYLGAPLIGDMVYGNSKLIPTELRKTVEGFGRQALHAYKLGFDHPISGERLTFESSLPNDFVDLISRFKGCKKS